jgi:peptide-methionine (R)-S-oxide reductase
MSKRRLLLAGGGIALAAVSGASWRSTGSRAADSFEVTHSDAEWRKRLTPVQYAVLRQSETERPFSSPLLHEERRGTFTCAGCDSDLFASTTKFDSGTGWPSFRTPLDGAVSTTRDTDFGMVRVAVTAAAAAAISATCSMMVPSQRDCDIV